MDEAVKRAQTWLNDTYNGKKGYSTITDDGIIGAGTIKALIIALQIEEGDSNPDGIFGKNTAGRPSRQLSKGLIYALQAEQGLAVGSADGLFGPATQKKCPTLSAGDTRQGYIKIMKYALYLNGIDVASFSGTFGADTTEDVRSFQTFASLPVAKYGVVDPMTWASLLTSKGDTSRGTQACDTSKVLTTNRLVILKSKNYLR